VTRCFRFAARHFITYTRRLSAAPFHELVKGLEICALYGQQRTPPFAKLKAFQPLLWRRIGLCLSYLPCSVAPLLSLANVAPQRVCHRLRHCLILPIASRGIITSIPNRAGTVPKSRTLNVTNVSARPLTAVSSTISSPGSRSCGLHRKFHRLRHRHHRIQEYF
jgi:hypothetical protein